MKSISSGMNLEKIAQAAGVSRATVSRVINNYPYVSEAVRERVLAVIAREGFQPSAAARALARRRTEVLGIVAPEGMGSVFSMMYFSVLLEGVAAAISHSEYVMSLWAGSTPDETDRMYRRILGYRLMDGALLLSSVEDDPLPRQLQERRLPLVMVGRAPVPEISTVDVDNIAAARAATEHLIRLGRRRIAHLTGNLKLYSARERLQGYQMALQTARLENDPALIIPGDYIEQSGYAAARQVVALGAEAVFAASDNMAAGLLQGLSELGVAVPSQVAVVGFDDLPLTAQMRPALTTVRQPIRDLGVAAISMLIDLVEGRLSAPHRIVLPTELIVRESCGMLTRP